jgi:SAM-dependent methyltransferase
MNAFEHYRCPQLVMSEIHRILKPGGCLFLHTSGLQPLHEAPFHFYNVTRYGLQEWLKGYEIQHLGVSPNFNPLYSLSWIASEIEKGVATHQPAELEAFHNITLRELIKFWRSPNARQNSTYETFYRLDSPTQESCAAGWEAIAYKK